MMSIAQSRFSSRSSSPAKKRAKASSLSILSGKFKGAKLASPGLATTHPMGSREKLALFNMLSPYLEGATVLDYFAGSGSLGLEALSRGAASVTFVENNPRALQTIRENCKNLGEVRVGDASSEALLDPWDSRGSKTRGEPVSRRVFTTSEFAMDRDEDLTKNSTRNCRERNSPLETSPTRYDVIISDPPYDNYEAPNYAELLRPGGILALSHPRDFDPGTITGLTLLKTNHYAACHISLFAK